MHHRWLLVVSTLLAAACGASLPAPPSTLTAPPQRTAVAPSPPATNRPIVTLAKLTLDATGLGPCDQPWYVTCDYGIRLEGAGGYDHRGTFSWEEGPPKGMAHGTAGPVHSTGVAGDLPTTLGLGTWTLSFRLYYGSDAVSMAPVPGGTPRYSWEDPFTAACSTSLDTAGIASVTIHVAFKGSACKVVASIAP